MKTSLIFGLSAALLLSGCASNTLRYAATEKAPVEAKEREAAGIIIERKQCGSISDQKFDPLVTPIITALASVGIDFAINLVQAELKRQKEGQNAVWVAAVGTNILADDGDYCLTIYRGVLLKDSQNLKNYPAFEALIDLKAVTVDKTVLLTARPYEIRYAETSAPVRGKNRKDVNVILAFSPQTLQPETAPGKVPETKAAPVVLRLDLGRLDVGKFYNAALLKNIAAVGGMPKIAQTTITAVVSESEDSTAALNAVTAAFDSNKADIAKALKDIIKDAVGNDK
jgi:hypothetical protein